MKKSFIGRIQKGILCGVLCAALLYTGSVSSVPDIVSAAEVNDSKVQSLESEISKLQEEQNKLQAQINSVKNDYTKTSEYKQYMDSMVTATSEKIALAESLVEELNTKIADTEAKIKETEESIEGTREKVVERLRYAQENGNVSELELILEAEGMSDFLSRLDKVNSMLDYDREVMEKYRSEKVSLEQYKETLEASKKTQADTLVQLEADKSSYAAISAENATYMESLQNDQAKFEAEYEKVAAAEAALDAELTAYIQKMQSQNQVVPSGDGFMRPLPQGVGYVSSAFGWRDLFGRNDYHGATDIACAQGTAIYAANSGKVLVAEYHWSYGNYVIIDHGGGISTLYAHCTYLTVGAGEAVNKGDVIGYVGQTGTAYGAHLHLEVRVNGTRVNPSGYVPV